MTFDPVDPPPSDSYLRNFADFFFFFPKDLRLSHVILFLNPPPPGSRNLQYPSVFSAVAVLIFFLSLFNSIDRPVFLIKLLNPSFYSNLWQTFPLGDTFSCFPLESPHAVLIENLNLSPFFQYTYFEVLLLSFC